MPGKFYEPKSDFDRKEERDKWRKEERNFSPYLKGGDNAKKKDRKN